MADDEVARRREIRRKKILEQSEARLNRITSSKRSSEHGASFSKEKETSSISDSAERNSSPVDECESSCENNFHSVSADHSQPSLVKPMNARFQEDISQSINGQHQRSNTADNYIFPKKVSDTESRSFVRSRSDVRRSSTCTQIMMETLQLSSISVSIFRPWLAALLGICLQMYFLCAKNFLMFQSLLLPYILFEIGILTWLQYESQVSSRQTPAPLVAGLLLLCNISPHVISRFNSVLYHVFSCVQDLSIYLFSFLFLHFVCENYM